MHTIDSILSSDALPLVAILRGVNPEEVIGIGEALYDGGIRIIEVPLNSPSPLKSISLLQNHFGERALIGAGTVTNTAAAEDVAKAGGQLIVSPNLSKGVIDFAVRNSLQVMPGIFTPTEAWAGIDAGARHLKVFPAANQGPSFFKAMKDVLPNDVDLWAVGGVNPSNLMTWLDAGATGAGIGSGFFKPGDNAETVAERVLKFKSALQTP